MEVTFALTSMQAQFNTVPYKIHTILTDNGVRFTGKNTVGSFFSVSKDLIESQPHSVAE